MDAHGRPTLDAERLLDVLDGVPVLFYVQDPEGRITYANHAACELVGRPPADVIAIGICVAPVEGPTREQLLDLADAAMYRAKAGGPGRYVIAD